MKVGIIGLGLIGGSMAIDLRRRGFADSIVGVDADPVNAAAAERIGLVDKVMQLEECVDGSDMVIVGGADEAVVGNVHQLPQIQDTAFALDDVIHKLLGGHAGSVGFVLDLLAVLVGTGEEVSVKTGHLLEAGHGVGSDGGVGMADVHITGGVIDRRGQVKLGLAVIAHE
jgi:hypothetical protein